MYKIHPKIMKSGIKPLQIYLDSSDYSHMSNPKSDSYKKYQIIKNELQLYVERGVIEIRFSMIHVLEMTHTEEIYKDAALRRVDAMLDLCGSHAIVDLPTLQFLDARYLLKINSTSVDTVNFPYYAYDDSGVWFSAITDSFVGAKEAILNQFKDSLKETGQPRHQRRKAMRLMSNKHGFSNEVKLMLQMASETLMNEMEAKIPLTERFYKENMLIRFLTGEISESEFNQELAKGFLDVRNFVEYHIDRTFAGLRSPAEALIKLSTITVEDIRANREQIERLILLSESHDDGASEFRLQMLKKSIQANDLKINAYRSDYLRSMFVEYKKWAKDPIVSTKKWNEVIVASDFGKIPSFDCFIGIFKNYYLHAAMFNGKDNKFSKIKNSDWGDVMHARYLPYVHVFRSDSSFSKHISEIATGYGTKIVNKIDDLLPIIKDCLS